jgi:gliding motility-associated-like protein
VLTTTTWYRRIVNSSICSDKSLPVKVTVHNTIATNNIFLLENNLTDTTLCYDQLPNRLLGSIATGGTDIPGSYTYQWTISTDNVNFSPVATGGTGINYQHPSVLYANTYFKRMVTSGACIGESNAITINVLPLITNNTISSSKPAVCYSLVPDPITGVTLAGGSGTYQYLWEESTDGAIWIPASGTNTSSSYQPPALTIPMKYKRTVRSGVSDCCISTSNIFDLGIDPLPISPIFAGDDQEIYSIERTTRLNADPVIPAEEGFWTVLAPMTGIIDNSSSNNAEVRNLSEGENLFLWTVTNGPCKLEDSVKILLYEDFIPQGFSPNADFINDKFIIEGLNLTDQLAELIIVNGAGTEVFSTSNQGGEFEEWDGKNSKGIDLPEGTYYYLLKVTSKIGQVFKKSGFIVLKRY